MRADLTTEKMRPDESKLNNERRKVDGWVVVQIRDVRDPGVAKLLLHMR